MGRPVLHLRILDLRANWAALGEAAKFWRRHQRLVAEMTKRELTDRYAGQIFGALWAFAVPLLTMAIYVFAFTVLFKGRLGPGDHGLEFTSYAISGMAPWLALQDSVARSAVAVSGSANLVKQIVFPVEVLPIKVVLATLPGLAIGLAVAVVLALVTGRGTALGLLVLLPAAIALLLAMCAGFSFAAAAIGVFVRDVKDIIGVAFSLGFFLHPIIYPPQGVPHWLELVFASSPVSHVLYCFRDAIIWGEVAHPLSWLVSAVAAVVIFVLGWRLFKMLRPTFGNAL
jgi:lipopolysaccharide transport system permease protein